MTSGMIYVLMGPTASGKTQAGIDLARRLNGEVVSADSMQLYRMLDIGTAKPTMAERAGVPHHLLDVWEIDTPADVFAFCRMADEAIRDIQARGKTPIVVGGTGMYLKALLYGFDDLPADRDLRARLDAQYDSESGFAQLQARMRVEDPEDLVEFGHHRRKAIRAFEVFLLTGKPMKQHHSGMRTDLRYPASCFVLNWPREELKRRIALRTGAMLDAGWIDEARKALAAGLLSTPTAHQALGYRLIGEYLAGKMDRQTLEARIATATWQLARRQITWFRHQHPEARQLEMPCDFRTLAV